MNAERLRGLAGQARIASVRAFQDLGTGFGTALLALGRPVPTVGAHPERDPVWPADVVGSITHTDGWVAAVVARAG